MNLKKREETKYIRIQQGFLCGKRVAQLKKEARKVGELDVPFHYLIHENGCIEEGRDREEIGDPYKENSEISLDILLDVTMTNSITDSQKVALDELLKALKELYPKAKVQEEEKENGRLSEGTSPLS